ncbi:MAG: right-handed parallel beta-helix repeat-containing protein, partial [Cardiobacteriaceae bacterium]|nr:right-handed parallel beta-helix repeat-containing protein [Cardiobacteriaceae bacterium]
KGDGKTDDTAAIQKAINAVAEKGGGIVEIPAGTYLVDGTKNVVMKSNVIVRMADDTVLKTIPNDQPTYAIFRVQNVENVHFLGGTLVGDRYEHGTTEGQSGWGVQIYSSRNVVVENVVARDFRGDGFMVGRYYLREPQPENIVFYNVTADGNRRQGLFISDGDHIKVLNSTFKNTQGHPMEAGIDIEPNAPPDSPTGVPGIVRDVEVSGNTFENNAYYGIVVSRSRERPTTLEDVRITNNTFSGDGHAIHVIGLKGGEISGNTIADSNIDIPYFDINLEYSQNVAVRDNTMYGGRDRDLVKEGVTSSNTLSGSVRHAAVHIEGSAKVGETLTATVLDGDGQPTPPHITYTWRAGSDIVASGKNLPTYTVRPEDAGKAIRVAISFPHIYGDVAGQQENATSAPTLPVGSAGQHAPTDLFLRGGYTLPEKTDGAVVGKVTVRDKDVADHYALTVSDERFEIDSSGMLKLKAGQQIDYAREKYVSLALTARDDSGALSEAFTLRVQPPTPSQDANKPAAVIVQGFAKPGETLTAVVKDADDAPAGGIRYQWYADSQAIDGATASTYQVRAADAGKQIQVKADYTDNAGHRESMMSGATMTVPGAYSPPAPKPPANDGKLGVHVPKPVTDFVANAKDFGAKGDGQADDTLAIQKAIDAVAGKGGGVVEISGGTYMINTIAQAGKHSIVAADRTGILMKSNVILKLADDAVLQALPNASKGYSIVTFYDVDNAHLIGGTLIGERQQHQSLEGQSGHGVRILSAQNVAIENVTARDFWGDGFIVGINSSIDQRSQNIVFYNVTADNNRRQGMSIVDGQHIKVLDSVFKNTNGHMPLSGIDIEPNPGGVTTDIDIRGNRFENNSGFGVVVSGSQFNRPNSPYRGTTTKNINIENNVFEGNRDGIAIEGLIGGRVANNTIRHGNVVTSPSGGIRKLWLDDMSRDIVVENNTIYGGGYPRGYIEHGKLIEGGGIENLGQNNIVRNNDYKADVFIRGLVKSGETLTAHVYDGDIVPANVRYQWRADGKPIANANARSYRLTDADNGKRISVHVEFTDGADEKESATSAETNPVGSAQPNHAPHWAYVVGQYIADETPGHVIGKFGVHDPDPGETFSYRINDERFEIVADVLKLKNGISINDANEKSVSLAIEITDSGGDRFVRELDLTVAEYGTDGKDTFVVDGNGVKTIVGFNVSNGDVLQLESDAFTALEKGALAPGAFVKGKAATASSADHRILYDTESGTLAYDPDGNGSAAAVTIARLDPAAELEAAHILII